MVKIKVCTWKIEVSVTLWEYTGSQGHQFIRLQFFSIDANCILLAAFYEITESCRWQVNWFAMIQRGMTYYKDASLLCYNWLDTSLPGYTSHKVKISIHWLFTTRHKIWHLVLYENILTMTHMTAHHGIIRAGISDLYDKQLCYF